MKKADLRWTAKTVSSVLHNETYIRTYVCNRTETIAPRVSKQNDKDNWLVFKNHHEPMVSQEMFESVKKRFHKYAHKVCQDNYYNELKGKVYCKGCGKTLERHHIKNKALGKTFYYKCDYGNQKDCCKKMYVEDFYCFMLFFDFVSYNFNITKSVYFTIFEK